MTHNRTRRPELLGKPLTRGQRQALELAALGFTSEEIGRALHFSAAAAGQALDRARWRLGARNIAHAVALAMAEGLLDPNAILAHRDACAQLGIQPSLKGQNWRGTELLHV